MFKISQVKMDQSKPTTSMEVMAQVEVTKNTEERNADELLLDEVFSSPNNFKTDTQHKLN